MKKRGKTTCAAASLAVMITVLGGCGSADRSEDYDKTPPLIDPSVPTNSGTACAPTAATQAQSGDTVYYRYTSAKTWTAAKADCEAMGGRLAVPTSASVNSTIKGINAGASQFIGIYQSTSSASPSSGWQTIVGVAANYANWRSGEPNDYPSAAEDNQENCVEMASDGGWNDAGCSSGTRAYVCEFGQTPLACGGGASCAIPSGSTTYSCQCSSGQTYDVTNNACYGGPLTLQVNSLEVDRAASGTAYVNYPIHATVGLIGSGNTNSIQVQLGMIERPPSGASASTTEQANLRSCEIAGARVTVKGDGSQAYATIDGIIPPECLGTDSQRNYNFYVLLDPVENVSSESNKFLVYNVIEQSSSLAQVCKTTDPATGAKKAGCVIDVTLKQPPGVDISLESVTPVSSVAVLDPNTTDPYLRSGGSEAPRPLFTVNTMMRAFGRSKNDASASLLPGSVTFAYDIKAVPDTAGIGWQPLSVNPDGLHPAISNLKPGEKLETDGRLHPTANFRTLTSTGGAWAGITDYQVRGCAIAAFVETGDPTVAGSDGKQNNCKTFSVKLVFGSGNTSAASSLDETKTYSNSWGSSSTLQLTLSAGTTNHMDTTGMYSNNDAKATVSGFFGSVTVIDAWGDATSVKSSNSGSIDYGLKIFGYSLISHASETSYNQDWSASKETCITYTYGISVVSASLSGCFTATIGLDMTLTASGTSLTANVRPYVSATLSVSGSLSVTLYKLTVTASVTLLGLNTTDGDGVTGAISYTITSTSPVTLKFTFSLYAYLRISTLSGSIVLDLEQLSIDYCSFKVFGHKVYYPCGTSYETIKEVTLFSYSGYSTTQSLLDRISTSASLTL